MNPCPLCKGAGQFEPPDPQEKAEIARYLVEIGLSYREIARVLGWKSANSVTHAIKDKTIL